MQLLRRPATGVGSEKHLTPAIALGSEVLALQRQQFSKNLTQALLPRVERARVVPAGLELGRAVLDEERGGLIPLNAVILPLPYLDLDPTFIHLR